MNPSSRMIVITVLLTLAGMQSGAFAQGKPAQSDGWQGPRPTPPQQRILIPGPQSPAPSGKQVLEIPPQPQQTVPALSAPQAVIPPQPQPETKRPNQLVTVTVTDQLGNYIPGLRPEDFTIYEDDMPQALTYFNTGQNEPVSLGLVVDMSGSMMGKVESARRALRRFVTTIHPRDEVFLEAFNQRPIILQDFTDSRALLLQATAALEPRGGTALYDAILDGLRRVQQGHHQKRALIVITDGLDVASVASRSQTIEAIRQSGVLVYTIGVGNPNGSPVAMVPGVSPMIVNRRRGRGGPAVVYGPSPHLVPGRSGTDETVDSRTLQELSAETGGQHFLLNTEDVVGSLAVLDEATQAISNELRQQYSLGYKSPLKGDVYRSIRVETRRDGVVIRTQKGAG